MNKKIIIHSFLLLSFLFIQCRESSDPITGDKNIVMLNYKFMHGWTGKYIFLSIYESGDAIRYNDSGSESFQFSVNDKKYLYSLLSKYSSFKKTYKPENGQWCDIDLHWLVYYPDTKVDSVSIYIPLSDKDIPSDLRNLINLLMSKI